MDPSTSSSKDEPINDFGQVIKKGHKNENRYFKLSLSSGLQDVTDTKQQQGLQEHCMFLELSELSASSLKRLRSREVYSEVQGATEGKKSKCYTGEAVINAMALLFVTKDVTMENLMSKLNTIFNRREKVATLDLSASVTRELKMCIKRMIEAELDDGAKDVCHAVYIWFEKRFYDLRDLFIAQISTLITIYSAINGNIAKKKGKELSAEDTETLISWTLNIILSPLWPLSDAHYCHTLRALFETVTEIVPLELKYVFKVMSELTMCYNWDLTALRYMKDNVFILPKELERFLKSEDFRVLRARVRVLCDHGFFDYALTLCSAIVGRLNSYDEFRKSMPAEAALRFRDVFYILLAKRGSYEKFTSDISRNMQISSGLYFIRRLANHNLKDLPVSLIPSLRHVSSICSRVFFWSALHSPPEITDTNIMEGLILEWFNNAVEDIREGITNMTTKCRYSQHIYSLCKVLEENVHSLKTSELVAVYVDGLKRDVADRSELKVNVPLRAKVGQVLYKLAEWFSNNRNLYREMILCCFSVYPTVALLNRIRELWTPPPSCEDATAAGKDGRTCQCSKRRRGGHELCEACGLFGRTPPSKPFRASYFEAEAREALKLADLDLGSRDRSALARVLYRVRRLSGLSWDTKPNHLSSLLDWHLTNFHSNYHTK